MCEFKHILNPADKHNSLIDDLKKTVQKLQSDKIKPENYKINLEIMLKALRADKVISNKIILHIERISLIHSVNKCHQLNQNVI